MFSELAQCMERKCRAFLLKKKCEIKNTETINEAYDSIIQNFLISFSYDL